MTSTHSSLNEILISSKNNPEICEYTLKNPNKKKQIKKQTKHSQILERSNSYREKLDLCTPV